LPSWRNFWVLAGQICTNPIFPSQNGHIGLPALFSGFGHIIDGKSMYRSHKRQIRVASPCSL
jgi:hypothetical protein